MARDTSRERLDFSHEWPADKLIAIGGLALLAFLIFIYNVSP